jgi:hypothetical protein
VEKEFPAEACTSGVKLLLRLVLPKEFPLVVPPPNEFPDDGAKLDMGSILVT